LNIFFNLPVYGLCGGHFSVIFHSYWPRKKAHSGLVAAGRLCVRLTGVLRLC
jgi:hypothetical protein